MTVIGCSESASRGRAAGACGVTSAGQGDGGRSLERAGMALLFGSHIFPMYLLCLVDIVGFEQCFSFR